MALRIPIYDQPQVRNEAAPMPQLRMNAPNLGAAIGQGLQNLGATIAAVQEKAQLEADQQVVLEKSTAFQEAVNKSLEDTQQVRGNDIRDFNKWGGREGQTFADRQLELLTQRKTELSQSMTTRQRLMFDQHANPSLTRTTHAVRQHEFGQIDKIKDETAAANQATNAATAVNSVDDATGKVDEGMLQSSLQSIRDVQSMVDTRKGAPKEVADRNTQIATSATLLGVLQKLEQKNNSTDIKRILDTYGANFTEKDRAIWGAKQKDVNDKNQATLAVIYAETNFRNEDTGLIDTEAGKDYLRTRFIDNPEARDKAVTEFVHSAELRRRTVGAKEDESVDAILKIVANGGGPSAAHAARIEAALPGKTDLQVKEHIDAIYHARQARSESNPYLREQQAVKFVNLVTSPDFSGKSLMDITGQVRDLGPSFMLQAVEALHSAKNPKRGEVDFSDDQFKAAAYRFGFLKADGKAVEGKAMGLKLAQVAVNTQIANESVKGPISLARKNEIVGEQLSLVTVRRNDKNLGVRAFNVSDIEFVQNLPPAARRSLEVHLIRNRGYTKADVDRLTPTEVRSLYTKFDKDAQSDWSRRYVR